MAEATGRFEVTMAPEGGVDPAIGSLKLEKTFHGDLEGVAIGHMLAIRSPIDGSAGYVAMDRVTGTLAGRSGGFALQHSGTMDRGRPTLSITIVPDSGAEGLSGITGSLDIEIKDGVHHYRLSYALPA